MGCPPRVPAGHQSQNKNSEATERNSGIGSAKKQSDRRACVLYLFATISRGTGKRPRPPKYGEGSGVGPGAWLKRQYVCLRATCHPSLILTTHRMPRPLPRTDACRLAAAVTFPPPSPPSRAGQAATARHGRAAALRVYIEGAGEWRSVDAHRAHGRHDMHLQQVQHNDCGHAAASPMRLEGHRHEVVAGGAHTYARGTTISKRRRALLEKRTRRGTRSGVRLAARVPSSHM